jgi:hypothetical protein
MAMGPARLMTQATCAVPFLFAPKPSRPAW